MDGTNAATLTGKRARSERLSPYFVTHTIGGGHVRPGQPEGSGYHYRPGGADFPGRRIVPGTEVREWGARGASAEGGC